MCTWVKVKIKVMKIQITYIVRGLMTNLQLLMLSPNLLKTQISYRVGWGRGVGDQLPTFDAESKSAQNPNSQYSVGGGRGGGFVNRLPTFDAESKSTKNPNSLYHGKGGLVTNFHL